MLPSPTSRGSEPLEVLSHLSHPTQKRYKRDGELEVHYQATGRVRTNENEAIWENGICLGIFTLQKCCHVLQNNEEIHVRAKAFCNVKMADNNYTKSENSLDLSKIYETWLRVSNNVAAVTSKFLKSFGIVYFCSAAKTNTEI